MRKNKLYSITLMAFLFLLGFFNMEVKAASKLSVEVQTGIEQIQQLGKNLPITIVIENKGDAFKGDVLVNTGYKNEAGHALVKSINLEKGEKVTVRFLAEKYTVSRGTNKVLVYEDNYKDGKKVAYTGSGIIKEPKILEGQAAILSLDFSKKEIDSIAMTSSQNQTIIYKNSNHFNMPTDERYIDAIALMLVKGDTLLTWTEEQQEALLQWIRNGGKLYVQGQAALPENLIKSVPFELMSSTSEVTSNQLNSYLKIKSIDGGLTTYEAKLNKNSSILVGDSSQPIIGKIAVGEGEIIQANFTSWPTEQSLVNAVMKELNTQLDVNNTLEADAYNTLEGTTEIFPTFHFSLVILLLVLVAYILIIAPLLYFILKKKDKREYAWWIIPLGAMVTSIAIFAFSSNGRLFKSTIQQSTVTTLNDGHATTKFSHSLLTNKSGDMAVSTSSNNYLSRTVEAPISQYYKNAVLKQSKEKSRLNLVGLRYWDVATVVGQKTENGFGQIEASLTIDKGYLTGEITNDLNYKLTNVQVWSGNKKYKIGSIEKGKTVHVKEKVKEQFLAAPISREEPDFYTQPSNNEELLNYQKAGIENIVLRENEKQGNPLVVGWIKEDLVKATYDDLNSNTISKNIVVQGFVPGINLDQGVFLNEGSLSLQITDLQGDGYAEVSKHSNDIAFGKGSYQLDYSLPKILTANVISWNELKFNYLPDASYSMELFNFNTNSFEKLEEKETLISKNVANYISQDNKLRFKVIKNNDDGLMLSTPKIQMKGAEKDD